MEHLVAAVRASLRERNWYAALSLALTLPDIASKAETPEVKSSTKRYTRWADEHITPRYTSPLPGIGKHVFLSGTDCYALRCAVLHEGSDQTVEQWAHKALEGFIFREPPERGRVHCNHVDYQGHPHLQLQVDLFCEDICQAVEGWQAVATQNTEIMERLNSLMKIAPPSASF